MKKFIAALLFIFITVTYTSAYSIYNSGGEDWRKGLTNRMYIVFESKAEYESNKATMEKANFILTDREIDYEWYKTQELSCILAAHNVKPGAYIVEFLIEEVPGGCDKWYAQVNYNYVK